MYSCVRVFVYSCIRIFVCEKESVASIWQNVAILEEFKDAGMMIMVARSSLFLRISLLSLSLSPCYPLRFFAEESPS